MQRNKISVIIPAFNAQNTLKNCALSILENLEEQDEIIIVDDASTDHTSIVISELKKCDNRIYSIDKSDNEGVSAARNDGMKIAKGSYICFLDADDYWDTGMRGLLNDARLNTYDLICSGTVFEYPENNYKQVVIPRVYGEFTDNQTFASAIMAYDAIGLLESICNKIYSKKIIEEYKITFPNGVSNLEDLEFNCLFLKGSEKIYISKQASYHYVCLNNLSLSAVYKPNMMDAFENISKLRLKMYQSFDWNKEIEKHCNLKQKNYLIFSFRNLYLKDSPLNRRKRIEEIKILKKLDGFNSLMCIEDPSSSLFQKIMTKILLMKNKELIDLTCTILYKIRYFGDGIYSKKIRNLITKTKEQDYREYELRS